MENGKMIIMEERDLIMSHGKTITILIKAEEDYNGWQSVFEVDMIELCVEC